MKLQEGNRSRLGQKVGSHRARRGSPRGAAMICHHGQEGASFQRRAMGGAERQRSEGAHEVVYDALVTQQGAGIRAAPVSPGPIRNPAKHGAIQAQRSSRYALLRQAQLCEAVGCGQKYDSPAADERFSSQAPAAEDETEVLQACRSRHGHNLLADFDSRSDEFGNLREIALLSNNQSARGCRRGMNESFSGPRCHISIYLRRSAGSMSTALLWKKAGSRGWWRGVSPCIRLPVLRAAALQFASISVFQCAGLPRESGCQ